MKPFRDSVWMSADPAYTVKSGFVMPGMENRGCAGWGTAFPTSRGRGPDLRTHVEFSMASRDSLDMMFIASWSDYTEGTRSNPRWRNGDRELRTTLHYAAQFKEMPEDASGIALPARLFGLRKRSEYLAAARRRKTADADALLDQAATAIAEGSYSEAAERALRGRSGRRCARKDAQKPHAGCSGIGTALQQRRRARRPVRLARAESLPA